MHWSSEWAEQHYDISSTTSPPAHPKPHAYPQPSHPAFNGYSDDIGALSASSLLKRYAERYSFNPAYPEPGAFRRSEPAQDVWSMGYNPEGLLGLDGVKGTLGSASNISEQFGMAAISQDYASTYSGPQLYPKPTYLTQPAFGLPPTYPPPGPGYSYPSGLTSPSSPSLLNGGIYTPTPINGSTILPQNSVQEFPHNRRFGFDQTKTARVAPYAIRDNGDSTITDGPGNKSADLQVFRPERLLSEPEVKADLVRKTSLSQSLDAPTYGNPEQYTYP